MKKMKEFLKERISKVSENQKGFSLVELIIVIAILGIIAAIALPNVMGALDNSRKQADITNAKAIANAVAILEATKEGRSETDTAYKKVSAVEADLDLVAKELNGNAPQIQANQTTYDKDFYVTRSAKNEIKVFAKLKGNSEYLEIYPNLPEVSQGVANPWK